MGGRRSAATLWPGTSQAYWPFETDEVTVPIFVRAFETLDYTVCADGSLEDGFEKVAIYAWPSGEPRHAARQLRDGTWTSKMGIGYWPDIRHNSLDVVSGLSYGAPVKHLRRVRRPLMVRVLRHIYHFVRAIIWETTTFTNWLMFRGNMYDEES